MTSTRISQAGGSGSGEAADKLPFSGPPESARGARSFSGLLCASCPASLAPGDGHLACFRCLGADHAAAAMAASVSCVACRELPEEGILSRHLFFSPAVDLADAIDLFRAGPDDNDGIIDADDDASMDDVFGDSVSGWPISSGRSWHLFTAAGGDPSTLKAPVKSYTDFTNVEGWADTQAPPLAALLCPGAGWRPNEKPLPPDRLQKQIVGLTDRVFVCASQSAAAVNNIALLYSAMVSLSADREAYGPEEAARWLAVSRFSSAILQLCQPIAVSAGRHMAWATMIQRVIWLSHTAVPERERASLVQGPLAPDGLFGPRFSNVLAHQQCVRENRSRFGGDSHGLLPPAGREEAGSRPVPAFQGAASDSSPGAAAAAAAADGESSATDREVPEACSYFFLPY
ncbi:unnamed protein product [Boreogadus saida]